MPQLNGSQNTLLKRQILVVEQDLTRRQRLYELLTRRGHPVHTIHSGEQVMAALQHGWPTLILIGDQLGDTTGAGLTERIRRLDDEVPIILLSRNGPPDNAQALKIQACLPQDIAEDVLIAEVERWLSAVPSTPSKTLPCTILIVDDEPKLRNLLKQFLELHGFTVATAGSGEEALKTLERAVPMFVLLDIGMDGMDGLVTLKKIKALPTPTTVIMVTGNPEADAVKEAMALGARDYLHKPFSPGYLEAVLLSKLFTG